jgi:hypothetical protein
MHFHIQSRKLCVDVLVMKTCLRRQSTCTGGTLSEPMLANLRNELERSRLQRAKEDRN